MIRQRTAVLIPEKPFKRIPHFSRSLTVGFSLVFVSSQTFNFCTNTKCCIPQRLYVICTASARRKRFVSCNTRIHPCICIAVQKESVFVTTPAVCIQRNFYSFLKLCKDFLVARIKHVFPQRPDKPQSSVYCVINYVVFVPVAIRNSSVRRTLCFYVLETCKTKQDILSFIKTAACNQCSAERNKCVAPPVVPEPWKPSPDSAVIAAVVLCSKLPCAEPCPAYSFVESGVSAIKFNFS